MAPTKDVYRDSTIGRAALRSLEAAGRVLGHERVRGVAAMRWRARAADSDEGFFKLAHRISPRLRDENPDLFKIPTAWTAQAPMVRTNCLGLEL